MIKNNINIQQKYKSKEILEEQGLDQTSKLQSHCTSATTIMPLYAI